MAGEGASWQDLLVMGIASGLMVGVGLALGWLLDSAVNTSPIFAVVGLVLGLAGAAFYTYVKFRTYLKN